jgi:hypothetical protein
MPRTITPRATPQLLRWDPGVRAGVAGEHCIVQLLDPLEAGDFENGFVEGHGFCLLLNENRTQNGSCTGSRHHVAIRVVISPSAAMRDGHRDKASRWVSRSWFQVFGCRTISDFA